MKCPTDDALVELALTGDASAVQQHVAGCPACAARFSDINGVMHGMEAAQAVADRGHEAGRARLLAALAVEPPPTRNTLLWRVLMDRRTWITSGAISAAVIVVVVLGWGGAPAVALADGLKPFKEAKSFSCDWVPLHKGKPFEVANKMTFRLTWAAPGSVRSEIFADGKPQSVAIAPHGKEGFIVDHSNKTVTSIDDPDAEEATILKLIDGLATYSGGDKKAAGTDEIDGVKAARFELEIPNAEAKDAPWRYRIWVHPETKRPVRLEFALQALHDPTAKGVAGVRLEKFEWDVKTDGLFDTKPPAGYKSAVEEKK
ncbi:hypothetical protein R5W23_006086 [Gemmata sp. JC673]|uniref:Zinc-finger domain-containing protein n=1 Tax=Gemmata algarum TaxID=2975278 RepID=A0ABU5EUN8_9BACT|nr:hypothetical protein [Gemmata algarum]MDY3558910.1 hypothetical protein [Gemmata algarum]